MTIAERVPEDDIDNANQTSKEITDSSNRNKTISLTELFLKALVLKKSDGIEKRTQGKELEKTAILLIHEGEAKGRYIEHMPINKLPIDLQKVFGIK